MEQHQFDEFKNEMRRHIADSVRETVNGKIDKIAHKLDTYIAEDKQWKKEAEPVIELGINVRGFSKVLLYIIGFLGAIGMAWGTISALGVKIFK